MASRKKKGKKRHVGRWLLIVASAFGIAALCLWFGLRNPYTFLEEFHPKKIEVNPASLLPLRGTLPRAVHRVKPPKTTLYVFSPQQSGAVLKAMRRELTREKGYVARQESPDLWDFDLAGKPDEGAVYASGLLGTMQRQMYESGFLIGSKPATTPSCIVVVSRRENWLEVQWNARMRPLHH